MRNGVIGSGIAMGDEVITQNEKMARLFGCFWSLAFFGPLSAT